MKPNNGVGLVFSRRLSIAGVVRKLSLTTLVLLPVSKHAAKLWRFFTSYDLDLDLRPLNWHSTYSCHGDCVQKFFSRIFCLLVTSPYGTDRQMERRTHTETDRQTDGEMDTHRDRQTDRQTERRTHTETDRQTDGETDTHRDRQTDGWARCVMWPVISTAA